MRQNEANSSGTPLDGQEEKIIKDKTSEIILFGLSKYFLRAQAAAGIFRSLKSSEKGGSESCFDKTKVL